MNDLSDLDWNAKANAGQSATKATYNAYAVPPAGYRPSPIQTSLTPQNLSRPNSSLSAVKSTAKSISPANDSFANLLSINSAKSPSNLTLQDRQKQLLQERQRQIEEQQKRQQQEAQFLDGLGGGSKATPAASGAESRNGGSGLLQDDEDDILAAFNSNATVDKSSHFPPPINGSNGSSRRATPAIEVESAQPRPPHALSNAFGNDDDDDPFGLGAMPQKNTVTDNARQDLDDDDILGDLGKPVDSRPKNNGHQTSAPTSDTNGRQSHAKADPLDKTMAELVDMGFPADKARQALVETNCSLQEAVSWLLNQAHEESKRKKGGSESASRANTPLDSTTRQDSRRRPHESADSTVPAWMRQEGRSGSAQRQHNEGASEKDAAQYAQEIGSSLFKSANSLWKQGQKKMQKAVSEFQQERDPSQPRWMVPETQAAPASSKAQPPRADPPTRRTEAHSDPITDEALLLESGGARPTKPSRQAPVEPRRFDDEGPVSRGRSPAQPLPERPTSRVSTPQLPPQQTRTQPLSKLSRQAVEDEAAQAYVSSSRRRRPAAKAEPEPEVDLFSPAREPIAASRATPRPSQSTNAAPIPVRSKPTTSASVARPAPTPRNVPSVTQFALTASSQHRKLGTEAFKRGDYAAAHEAYTAALTGLPPTHPVTILVLANRALTAIKTGDPKLAVSDADKALLIIGPTKGENETIDLGPSEPAKDMKDSYGKALMRKAEALEHMEKWTDAGTSWRLAVEAGVGGLVAVRGRDRCERAAKPTPAPKRTVSTPAHSATKAMPTPRNGPTSSLARPAISNAASAEAVRKLRAQNLALEKADDEKFALADVVHARIEGWKGGKADNLRALLGSLDNVLWTEANWKKVGMAELVLPNRVKVVYMKAIAKVHPDKIPQDATTEQRMISASVFSTLNEAWDKFKRDNNL